MFRPNHILFQKRRKGKQDSHLHSGSELFCPPPPPPNYGKKFKPATEEEIGKLAEGRGEGHRADGQQEQANDMPRSSGIHRVAIAATAKELVHLSHLLSFRQMSTAGDYKGCCYCSQ